MVKHPEEPAPQRPDWYYRLSPEDKAVYDAWIAEGAPSFLDEDEGGAMPAPPKPARSPRPRR